MENPANQETETGRRTACVCLVCRRLLHFFPVGGLFSLPGLASCLLSFGVD